MGINALCGKFRPRSDGFSMAAVTQYTTVSRPRAERKTGYDFSSNEHVNDLSVDLCTGIADISIVWCIDVFVFVSGWHITFTRDAK
jgi:hypothetical protein